MGSIKIVNHLQRLLL